jgi:hypothetical protein
MRRLAGSTGMRIIAGTKQLTEGLAGLKERQWNSQVILR